MKKYIHYTTLIFILSLLICQPAHAYIDPGTGSMLFSVVLCSVTTVVFLLKSLILKIKSKIFAEKTLSNNEHKFSIYSEGKQYYCVFKPILDEFEKREIDIMYYTSAEDDPVFNDEYKHIQCEYIGKGNKAYFKLAFLKADICLMTTPQLDVLQLKRSKNVKHYSHIFHSIGCSMGYRLFALDYYDSVLCDAEFQIPMIRELEKKRNLPAKKLAVVGSTYMDFNKGKIQNIKKTDYTILVAPSWGQFSLLNKCGETILENLKNTGHHIIVRPHPQSLIVDKSIVDKLIKKYETDKNIEWDFESDNMKSLSRADVLISDFSCIMMDYAFLFKKPFLYLNTNIDFDTMDCGDLDDRPGWRYKIMNTIGRELKIENGDINNIANILDQVKEDKNLEQNIINACNYAWSNQGKAAENIVDFLVETQKEVSEK